jgi:hypothetical protein
MNAPPTHKPVSISESLSRSNLISQIHNSNLAQKPNFTETVVFDFDFDGDTDSDLVRRRRIALSVLLNFLYRVLLDNYSFNNFSALQYLQAFPAEGFLILQAAKTLP